MSDIDIEQIKQIAIRMKDLREICDVSVEAIAKDLDIEIDVYNEYETAKRDIPIGFLYEFANYFNIELTTLLTGEEPRLQKYSLVKNGKGLNIERRKAYEYHNLAYNFTNKKAEPFLVTVPPSEDDDQISVSSHPGQEFNYVLEGTLKVKVDDHVLVLEPGDSLYFDSNRKHGMKALNGKEAKFLAFIIQ